MRLSGLYAVTPERVETAALVSALSAAIAGGAAAVQYRSKHSDAALRREQAAAVAALCRARGIALIVNDDARLAAQVGAAGVHIGRDDGSVAQARAQLGVHAIVGVSCYDRLDLAQRAQADGADYVAFGSFYPSRVKPGAARAPLSLLDAARRSLRLPIVAIGGITADNAPELIAHGADAVAVISALFESDDVRAAAQAFAQLFQARKAAADGKRPALHHEVSER